MTQIELKLAKSEPINWPSLLSSSETLGSGSGQASSSTIPPSQTTPVEKPRVQKKNWDKIDVEEDKPDSSDPVRLSFPSFTSFPSFPPLTLLSFHGLHSRYRLELSSSGRRPESPYKGSS